MVADPRNCRSPLAARIPHVEIGVAVRGPACQDLHSSGAPDTARQKAAEGTGLGHARNPAEHHIDRSRRAGLDMGDFVEAVGYTDVAGLDLDTRCTLVLRHEDKEPDDRRRECQGSMDRIGQALTQGRKTFAAHNLLGKKGNLNFLALRVFLNFAVQSCLAKRRTVVHTGALLHGLDKKWTLPNNLKSDRQAVADAVVLLHCMAYLMSHTDLNSVGRAAGTTLVALDQNTQRYQIPVRWRNSRRNCSGSESGTRSVIAANSGYASYTEG